MAFLAAAFWLAGCGGTNSNPADSSSAGPQPFELSSPAFAAGARIPRRYTCDGADVSLPIFWSGVPAKTTSLTLTMVDLNAPGGHFVHWQVTGLPVSRELEAGNVPTRATQGINGFGTRGYRGPCPPRGDPPHHYVITLTALIGRRVLASRRLTGTYSRR